MPRFFFHIHAHDDRHLDPEGNEYLHPREAEADAIVTIRSLIQSGLLSLDRVTHWVIHITDEAGVTHAAIPLQQVLAARQ